MHEAHNSGAPPHLRRIAKTLEIPATPSDGRKIIMAVASWPSRQPNSGQVGLFGGTNIECPGTPHVIFFSFILSIIQPCEKTISQKDTL